MQAFRDSELHGGRVTRWAAVRSSYRAGLLWTLAGKTAATKSLESSDLVAACGLATIQQVPRYPSNLARKIRNVAWAPVHLDSVGIREPGKIHGLRLAGRAGHPRAVGSQV